MRKRLINHVSDTIFWYLIYLLPVVAYCLVLYRNGVDAPKFLAFFEDFSVPVVGDIIIKALNDLFAANGILPLTGASAGIPIFSWYISMMIIHLAVDFLLFIPRLAHKYMNKFCQGD